MSPLISPYSSPLCNPLYNPLKEFGVWLIWPSVVPVMLSVMSDTNLALAFLPYAYELALIFLVRTSTPMCVRVYICYTYIYIYRYMHMHSHTRLNHTRSHTFSSFQLGCCAYYSGLTLQNSSLIGDVCVCVSICRYTNLST